MKMLRAAMCLDYDDIMFLNRTMVKRIPKKLVIDLDTKEKTCPTCGSLYDPEYINHCSVCGQTLDLSGFVVTEFYRGE